MRGLGLRIVLLLSLLLCHAPASMAGSNRAGPSHFQAEEIIAFAKKVERVAASKGARVFLLARVGSPPDSLPAGIRYTHTAFAVYSMIRTEDGREIPGYAIYNLYQKDKDPGHSVLVVDYPADFFAGVYELRAGVAIPTPKMQQRLLQVIASPTYAKLHNPNYSILANPYDTKFQNCTEHALDVIDAAIYRTDDIAQLKANARRYFQAQTVEINPLKLFFGSMVMSDVRTSDHEGEIRTATFTTLVRYLEAYHLLQEALTITP